jgi:hypothetical protein
LIILKSVALIVDILIGALSGCVGWMCFVEYGNPLYLLLLLVFGMAIWIGDKLMISIDND